MYLDAFGCPNNFMQMSTSYNSLFILALVLGIQVGILELQDRRGARFFIPQWLLPEKYNYHRRVQFREDEMCTICMMELFCKDQESQNWIPQDILVCPCNHGFHASCLQQWMEHKMECPTCRTRLPPL